MALREVGRSRRLVVCLCLVVIFSNLPVIERQAIAKAPALVEVPPLPSTVGRAALPEVATGMFGFEPPVTGQPGLEAVGVVGSPAKGEPSRLRGWSW